MTGWAIVAYGTAGPQGSKIRNRHGGVRESSPKVKPWREAVKTAALEAKEQGAPCLDGPVACRIVFTLARPASVKRTVRYPATRPDLDKYLRSTFDAITDAGLWADDSRVVDITRLAKVWPGGDYEALPLPGVLVLAAPVDEVAWTSQTRARARAWAECDRYGTLPGGVA